MKNIFLIIITLLSLTACKKGNENSPAQKNPDTGTTVKKSSFTLQFQPKIGNQPFSLETEYLNELGEPFRINIFKFIVGNIVLHKSDGTSISFPDNYFIANPGVNERITVDNIPAGTYSGITFDIGVDSLHHVKKASPGSVLDPTVNPDMFWEMTNEYIFMLIEGNSPSSSTASKNIQYHISGHKKSDYAVQTIKLDFHGHFMDVKPNATPNIHLYADVTEIFKNPVSLSFATLPAIHNTGENAQMFSNNYKDMFSFQHIEN